MLAVRRNGDSAMNLTFLERRRNRGATRVSAIRENGNTLRIVDELQPDRAVRSWEPRIVRNGESAELLPALEQRVEARAEVRAKRFHGNRVSEDRYATTIAATDGSPNALLAALSRAFAEVDDFRATREPDERVILQVSLIF